MDPKKVNTNPAVTGLGSAPAVADDTISAVVDPVVPQVPASSMPPVATIGSVGPSPFVSGEPPAQTAYGSGEPTAPEPVIDPLTGVTAGPTTIPTADPLTSGSIPTPAGVVDIPAVGVTDEPVIEVPAAPVSPLGGVAKGPKMSA